MRGNAASEEGALTFRELLHQLSGRELIKTLKRAYRRVLNRQLRVARASLRQRGPGVKGNKRDWDKGIRPHPYSRGGGFMLTVVPAGKRGYHVNRQGKEKPVVMWAEEGTQQRVNRRGKGFLSTKGLKNRGAMPKYGFLEAVEPQLLDIAEAELFAELERAISEAAVKAGFV